MKSRLQRGVVSGYRTAILPAGCFPASRGQARTFPGSAPAGLERSISEGKIASQLWILISHFECKIRMKLGHNRLRFLPPAQA